MEKASKRGGERQKRDRRETEERQKRDRRETERDDADAGRGRRHRGTRCRKDGGNVRLGAAVAGGAREARRSARAGKVHSTTRDDARPPTDDEERGRGRRSRRRRRRKENLGRVPRAHDEDEKSDEKSEGRERGARHDVLPISQIRRRQMRENELSIFARHRTVHEDQKERFTRRVSVSKE